MSDLKLRHKSFATPLATAGKIVSVLLVVIFVAAIANQAGAKDAWIPRPGQTFVWGDNHYPCYSDRIDALNAVALQQHFNQNTSWVYNHQVRNDDPYWGRSDTFNNPEVDAYWMVGWSLFDPDTPGAVLKRRGDALYVEMWGNKYEPDDVRDTRCWLSIRVFTFERRSQ